MAIGFAKSRYVSRSKGGNACNSSAYNARTKITDNLTGKTYNWTRKDDNVYHEVMLPDYVDKKFNNLSVLSNEVEANEHQKNSQVYIEWILALPKEKEVTLDMQKELVKRFIEYKGWVKEGLGVQIDIHEAHGKALDNKNNEDNNDQNLTEEELEQKELYNNPHAHLLFTTRRFRKDGEGLEKLKARDLQPKVINGKVIEETQDSIAWTEIQNSLFCENGLDLRVDLPHVITQEHVGPVRMRSIFNEAAKRNEEKKEAEINHLNSGSRVLEKVTKHISVFTKGDLVRAVKCIPDSEARARLVEDALSSSVIVPLVTSTHGEGRIKYYTTKSIRHEEERIMRLSSYVNNLANVLCGSDKIKAIADSLISDCKSSLTNEQHTALRDVMVGSAGLRILSGRAGTGKSHVLGRVCSISESLGVNVIGIAPTHKARTELAKVGYEQNDTVKGMLFKLHNVRFSLPKNSLIVVDEAGMIGNDDYRELLRVAATRKCNVILSGDDRQLSSVQRGGMFEVFANHYGSSNIYNIKRQSFEWGKNVAMAFSKGEVSTGLSILDTDNRIKWEEDASSSMSELLHDWSVSGFKVRDRLILAVRNKDVASLNYGAREYFKLKGKLTGAEYEVSGNRFMKGDRVLITKTNKGLGLTNGDLAEISYASGDKFTLRFRYDDNVDNDKYVSFDPSEYSGFRHGYATTVFKAQGASIKDVYVFHDGFSTLRNSYVALSRHVEQLRLYVNKNSTGDMSILTRQLANDFDSGSSLRYMSLAEYEDAKGKEEVRANLGKFDKIIVHAYDFFQKNMTKLADKYLPSSEYYNYQEPKEKYEKVEEVIDKTYSDLQEEQLSMIQEKMVVGGNNNIKAAHNDNLNISSVYKQASHSTENTISVETTSDSISNNDYRTRESAKTRFYRNADRIRAIKQYQSQKEEWGREYEHLKSELKFKAESITKELLGDPNKKLSNRRELRYGDHGKLAVCITGEKAGTWYDFAKGEGGDLFDLTCNVRKMSFKDSADYLKTSVGINSSYIKPNLQIACDHANNDNLGDQIKERDAKISFANKLYDKSKYIGDKSVARSYLKDHRAITVDLSSDIRTTGIYDKESKEYLPALVVYARDKHGDITGGQHILLDKDTKAKADILVPKKSFGVISGSFADLGDISIGKNNNNIKNINGNNNYYNKNISNKPENEKQTDITIIAEGLETGLSVKQALSEHSSTNKSSNIKTLCSLGIANIKNYAASKGEKIIIASDNDGLDSATTKTIQEAVSTLKEKGTFVEVIKPKMQGDFNDVLKDSDNGAKEIAKAVSKAIYRHESKTLLEYFASSNSKASLTADEREKIEFIAQFKLNEEKILNAYRIDPAKGKEELDKVVKPIRIAHDNVVENKNIINEININGGNIDSLKLTLELSKKYDDPHLVRRSVAMDKHIWSIREKYHLLDQLKEYRQDRQKAKNPKEAMIALIREQKFLSGLHDTINPEDHSKNILNSIKHAYEADQSGSVDKLYEAARYAHKEKIISPGDLTNHFKSNSSVDDIHHDINRICYKHHCRVLTDHCNRINSGEVIKHHGHEFDCVAEYLEHWKDNVNHDMLPIKQMNKQIERVHEQQRDRSDDHHMSLDM